MEAVVRIVSEEHGISAVLEQTSSAQVKTQKCSSCSGEKSTQYNDQHKCQIRTLWCFGLKILFVVPQNDL